MSEKPRTSRSLVGAAALSCPTKCADAGSLRWDGFFSPKTARRLEASGPSSIHMLESADTPLPATTLDANLSCLCTRSVSQIARLITQAEGETHEPAPTSACPGLSPTILEALERRAAPRRSAVIGMTGTGGAGKSWLATSSSGGCWRTSRRFTSGSFPLIRANARPGALPLGDRIRLNAIRSPRVYMRSLATRGSESELPEAMRQAIRILRAAGFDLIFVETSGMGKRGIRRSSTSRT